jgi:hypothetical protein
LLPSDIHACFRNCTRPQWWDLRFSEDGDPNPLFASHYTKSQTTGERGLQSPGSSLRRCLVADILHWTVKLPHILKFFFEETREVLFGCHESIALLASFNFPSTPVHQARLSTLENVAHRSSTISFSFSLASPGRIGTRSDPESALTPDAD